MNIAGRKGGFTIVELLIVIVVIAILAAISIVAYTGVTARARDAIRKSDLSQVADGLKLYNHDYGTYIESSSGCGVNGNGNGWLSAGPSDLGATLYPKSVITCLQDGKFIKDGQFVDPSGCKYDSGGKCGSYNAAPASAYMKATCLHGGVKATYLFAHLESGGSSASSIDGLCDAGSVAGFTSDGQKWGTHYQMNYSVQIL